MPTPCYLSAQGKTQGNITADAFSADSVGNTYVEGHEDEVLVQEVEHEITVPTDRQSGQPTGQRRHKPLTISVALNRSVPLFYNALVSGELLTDVSLKWYRTSIEGKLEHFFTTKLTDAIVVDINCEMPHCQQPENNSYTQLIEISFSYRKIAWDHEISGTSGSDDWRNPLS